MNLLKRAIKRIFRNISPKEIHHAVCAQESTFGTQDFSLEGKIGRHSLLHYYGNVYSQMGQDGIIAEIIRRLPESIGNVFVEFGAWDGVYLSNCRSLYEKGWSGVFIEGDKLKFDSLTHTYANTPQITCINRMVGAPSFGIGSENLSQILQNHHIPLEKITFVSIDVDGCDLEIFLDLGFKPPLILVEGGFSLSPLINEPITSAIAWNNIQQPLGYIVKKILDNGYTPVCFLQDTYAVRNDLIAPFSGCYTNPYDLYRNACYFLDDATKNYLMEFRCGNEDIKKFEMEKLGQFNPDPL